VVRGLAAGATDAQIGERIAAAGAVTHRAHADTWARTQTTTYYALGRARQIEGSGDAIVAYRYVVIVDDRTTPICQALAGRVVPKAKMTRFPPFHWNCRTGVAAVFAPRYGGPKRLPPLVDQDLLDIPDGFGVDFRELPGWTELAA
jgi:SPP1 gp7 family putative phage head morphogenesis protein